MTFPKHTVLLLATCFLSTQAMNHSQSFDATSGRAKANVPEAQSGRNRFYSGQTINIPAKGRASRLVTPPVVPASPKPVRTSSGASNSFTDPPAPRGSGASRVSAAPARTSEGTRVSPGSESGRKTSVASEHSTRNTPGGRASGTSQRDGSNASPSNEPEEHISNKSRATTLSDDSAATTLLSDDSTTGSDNESEETESPKHTDLEELDGRTRSRTPTDGAEPDAPETCQCVCYHSQCTELKPGETICSRCQKHCNKWNRRAHAFAGVAGVAGIIGGGVLTAAGIAGAAGFLKAPEILADTATESTLGFFEQVGTDMLTTFNWNPAAAIGIGLTALFLGIFVLVVACKQHSRIKLGTAWCQ